MTAADLAYLNGLLQGAAFGVVFSVVFQLTLPVIVTKWVRRRRRPHAR